MSVVIWPALLTQRLKLKAMEAVQNHLIIYEHEDACFCMSLMHKILCFRISAGAVRTIHSPALKPTR